MNRPHAIQALRKLVKQYGGWDQLHRACVLVDGVLVLKQKAPAVKLEPSVPIARYAAGIGFLRQRKLAFHPGVWIKSSDGFQMANASFEDLICTAETMQDGALIPKISTRSQGGNGERAIRFK